MSIKKLVECPHPIHKRYCNFWNFLLESYEGGVDYTGAKINAGSMKSPGFFSSLFQIFVDGKRFEPSKAGGNLFQHAKERDQDFQRRIEMSYYYNFCGPIIDIYQNHLFKQPITEEWKEIEPIIKNQEKNIDRKGSSILEFRKEVSDFSQIYGHVFVVCDKPPADRSIVTAADQMAKGHFPYFTIFHPQNVINWSLDAFGFPHWVLLRETEDGNSNPALFNEDDRVTVRYRMWTREEWILYNSEYEEIARDSHPIKGQVPIVPFYDKRSKKVKSFLGISSIADIALIARDIYNSTSELKQILRDQTFAFLAVQGTSSEYNELEIGVGKGLLYPMDRNKPEYVSPPASNAEVYFTHIDRQVTKIFQIAKIEGGSAEFSGQSAVEQSGVSKAWDFNQTNSALSQKAGNYEDGENKLWPIFAAWEGKGFTGSITYPREFSIQSLNEELAEAEQLSKRQLGEIFESEVNKAIVNKKFPRMTDAEVDKIIDESKTVKQTAEASRQKTRFPKLFNNLDRG